MLDEHRLKHHMIDEPDLLMQYNKDLSRTEAEKIVEKNKKAMEDPHYAAMEGKNLQEGENSQYSEEIEEDNVSQD
jgi:hypothetical protein